jgi:hypothetical protein
MKKKYLLATILISSIGFASPSPMYKNTKAEVPQEPSRNPFLDYSVGLDNNISYTFGVGILAIKPVSNVEIGHLGYVPGGTLPFDPQGSISPNNSLTMALYGFSLISVKHAELLCRLEGTYFKKNPELSEFKETQDQAIFLHDVFSKDNESIGYQAMHYDQSLTQANIYIGLAGYSLQYKKSFLQSYYGLSYSYLDYKSTITGLDDSISAASNTQTGYQSSVGGGIWGEIEAGVILFESKDVAFMISNRFRQGSEAVKTLGYLTKFKIEPSEGDILQDHSSALDRCSYSFYQENKLGFSLVSKPTADEPALFRLEGGITTLLQQGKDLIQKKGNGVAGDFYIPGLYLGLSYTM